MASIDGDIPIPQVSRTEPWRRVALIQRTVPHYRGAFFDRLRQALEDKNIELRLFYSKNRKDVNWLAPIELSWADPIKELSLNALGREICWQRCFLRTRDFDLVIVEQASRLLLNYFLFVRNLRRKQRLAFWGHGRNLKLDRRSPFGEGVKRFMSTRVHWWFAYTEMSSDIVRKWGFPSDRVTIVKNAMDTESLLAAARQLTRNDISRVRSDLGLDSAAVGLFCGSIHEEKRPEFLIESCDRIRHQIGNFHLLVVGSGPSAQSFVMAASTRPWIHVVGPVYGVERAPYFALADVLLMPGPVGLGILDSFSFGVPLITTSTPGHGPEIAYLKNHWNGIVVDDAASSKAYAAQVIQVLRDSSLRQQLVKGCRESFPLYTLDEMVDRFQDGIIRALAGL